MNANIENKSFTAVAIHTAAIAGEWIKSKQGEISSLSTKSSAHDLVTEVDKGAETMIRRLLLTYFPNHSFLGEESTKLNFEDPVRTMKKLRQIEYLWIVDPIDGTTNFVHGFPFYSVSIALAHRGEIIAGVIYDPSNDEMFVGEKGKGAYVHGERTKVSSEKQLQSSLLASGFPPRAEALAVNMQAVQKLAPKVRNIRTTGSAALHLAYVGAGRLSGFCEFGLSPWDVAAGSLIVKESGGKITDRKGRPYELTTSEIVASNGHIHDEFLDALAEDNDN